MKYIDFTIKNYRGIVEPLNIKIKEGSPIALVGFNESGKSTIIDAIYAFDYENDGYNDTYKQLENTSNLYSYLTENHQSSISSKILIENNDYETLLKILTDKDCLLKKEIEEKIEIQFNEEEIEDNEETIDDDSTEDDKPKFKIVKKVVLVEEDANNQLEELKKSIKFIEIERVINTDKTYAYILKIDLQDNTIFDYVKIKENEDLISKEIIKHLPTMLYVKEFETFLEEITLNPNPQQRRYEKQYRDLFNNLFLSATENATSLDDFIKITDTRLSQPILNKVQRYLNQEFTKRWTKFNIEHNFSQLSLDIISNNGKMKIQVSEKVGEDKFSFNISDRSSGFRWYFNFVMRTLFNPIHKNGNNIKTLYLMDEPGTFLHESSQKSFAQELKDILKGNFLIYTTHHFQMINLKNISLNNIYIVEKFDKLIVASKSTHYTGYNEEAKKGAMLPIFHTLRFSFIDLLRDEEHKNKKFLIVEGLHDYYFINLFIKDKNTLKDVEVYPSVGADQIVSNLPEFNFYNQGVYALFDNDQRGCEAKGTFIKLTNKEYENRVFVLPFEGYQEQKSAFTMNHIMGEDLIKETCKKVKDKGIYLPKEDYKSLMEYLYENQNQCSMLNSNADFKTKLKTLKEFLVEKLK